MSKLILTMGVEPATPSTGQIALYAKVDTKLYVKDDTGVETVIMTPNVDKLQAVGSEIILQGNHNPGAVNNLSIDNSLTGLDLEISATGTDTDIGIVLIPKGTGQISVPSGYVPTGDFSLVNKAFVVNKAGDTMSGFLLLSGTPVIGQHATTKDYVDGEITSHDHDATYVNVTGDTMIGSLTIDGEGAVLNVNTINAVGIITDIDMNLVPKGTGLILAPSGYDMSGGSASALATKGFVDTGLSGKSDTGHNHDATYVNVAGDTMVGSLTIDGEGAELNVSTINAIGIVSDVDLALVPKGAGLILAPVAYDMSSGVGNALATKTYVDSEIVSHDTVHDLVDDTSPQLGGMLDVNGFALGDGIIPLLSFLEDGEGVNWLQIENEATGSGPILRSVGADTNIDLVLTTKGTGLILAPFGYDMSGGPDRALATKDYVDTEIVSHDAVHDLVDDTSPQLGGMLDVNGFSIGDGTRTLLSFTEDASSVNWLDIENEATGFGPILKAVGADTNIDLVLTTKGTGLVIAPSGYDMSSGALSAFATKGYVDTEVAGHDLIDDTTPQLGGQLDVNGFGFGDGTKTLLDFTEDASAVNWLRIENEATGSGPILRSVGADTDVDLNLDTKGSGVIKLAAPIDIGSLGTPIVAVVHASASIAIPAIGASLFTLLGPIALAIGTPPFPHTVQLGLPSPAPSGVTFDAYVDASGGGVFIKVEDTTAAGFAGASSATFNVSVTLF